MYVDDTVSVLPYTQDFLPRLSTLEDSNKFIDENKLVADLLHLSTQVDFMTLHLIGLNFSNLFFNHSFSLSKLTLSLSIFIHLYSSHWFKLSGNKETYNSVSFSTSFTYVTNNKGHRTDPWEPHFLHFPNMKHLTIPSPSVFCLLRTS